MTFREVTPGCLMMAVFLLVATALFSTFEWALSWIGIVAVTPKSWWGHYSEMLRLYLSLIPMAVVSLSALFIFVGAVKASAYLLTWQLERRLRYLATRAPKVHAFLVETVIDSDMLFAVLWVSQGFASMVGVGLFIAKTGSLFWFTLFATLIPLAVFYFATIFACRGAGSYALYQVRRFLFPSVFVTPLLFVAAGIVTYLVYFAQAWIFIALGPIERIQDVWFMELASISPWEIDYLAIAQGMLWTIGALSLLVAILPLFVLRAYGKFAAAALGIASPFLTDQFANEIKGASSWMGKILTTVPGPLIAFAAFRIVDAFLGWSRGLIGGRFECPRCGHSLRDVERLCGVCGLPRS
jgi:hypothetical protein